MTRLSGYQPQYFPRLHYFNRILTSDVFEISDYVQFVAKHAFPQEDGSFIRGKSYQAHTPIKLSGGEFLLTIPVHDKLLPINKTEIDYSNDWPEKHLKSIEVGYTKALNFKKFYPEIEQVLKIKYENLAEFTLKGILWGIVRLITDDELSVREITVNSVNDLLENKSSPWRLKKIFLASESSIKPPEKNEANDWIINLCKYAGATEYYYGGTSHAAYMDNSKLTEEGITPVLQNWKCTEYTQQYMKLGFIPNLSIIDLVMNEDLKTRQSRIS